MYALLRLPSFHHPNVPGTLLNCTPAIFPVNPPFDPESRTRFVSHLGWWIKTFSRLVECTSNNGCTGDEGYYAVFVNLLTPPKRAVARFRLASHRPLSATLQGSTKSTLSTVPCTRQTKIDFRTGICQGGQLQISHCCII